jgi:hypothetical protein
LQGGFPYPFVKRSNWGLAVEMDETIFQDSCRSW